MFLEEWKKIDQLPLLLLLLLCAAATAAATGRYSPSTLVRNLSHNAWRGGAGQCGGGVFAAAASRRGGVLRAVAGATGTDNRVREGQTIIMSNVAWRGGSSHCKQQPAAAAARCDNERCEASLVDVTA